MVRSQHTGRQSLEQQTVHARQELVSQDLEWIVHVLPMPRSTSAPFINSILTTLTIPHSVILCLNPPHRSNAQMGIARKYVRIMSLLVRVPPVLPWLMPWPKILLSPCC